MSARLYQFHSTWNLAVPKQKAWQTLTATPFSWQEWWPELTNVRNMKVVSGLSGTSFSCTWRAPWGGYRLQSKVTIGKIIDMTEVTLHSEGDLVGTVTCHLREIDGQTRIAIDWRVETTRKWMRYLAPLLKPLFIYNHHAVMKSGEHGLREYLLQS